MSAQVPTPEQVEACKSSVGDGWSLTHEKCVALLAAYDAEKADADLGVRKVSELRTATIRLRNECDQARYEAKLAQAALDRVRALMEAQGPAGYVMNYALRGALSGPTGTPEPKMHGDHEFRPGIDIENPGSPDPRWCNVCGEAAATEEGKS